MNTQNTIFGSIQPIYAHNGEILVEISTFTSNGRAHKHDGLELCQVIKGKGLIIIEKDGVRTEYKVHQGCVVSIPQRTDHWMEVADGDTLVVLISYPAMVVYCEYSKQ